MQKIAHINFAKGFRGGERQTLLLIEELSKKGYIQVVVTREKSPLADKLEFVKNLEIIKISKPYSFNLKKIKDASLLHAHETKGAHFAYFANLFYKIPYIVTRRVDNSIKNNLFNKKVYENSTHTIALSLAIKNEILKISDKVDIKIIPSAYSGLAVNHQTVKEIKKRYRDKFLIGHIGELDNSHKGQYYLIEAMKMLKKKYPNIHLILLGRGKDEVKFKNQAKGMENITFEGFVDNVADFIECFDLFVFPSLNEGLGSILLDVINSDIPIIASCVGGIPDIIENQKSGILVQIKDSDAIYQNIIKLYEDRDFSKKLSLHAKQKISDYSPLNIANRYIEIYEKIL